MSLSNILLVVVGCSMLNGQPHDIVADEPSRQPFTLLVFKADWCPQCRVDKPTVAKIRALGKVEVILIDIDNSPRIAKNWKVKVVPTYILYRQGGKEIWRTHNVNTALKRIKEL